MKANNTQKDKKVLINAMSHVSFEMNRYLLASRPINLPGHFNELVAESCLLHARNVGEFFFEDERHDDIRITHFIGELVSSDELVRLIEVNKPKWIIYKPLINKKLSHLTFSRIDSPPMGTKNDLDLENLIALFEKNLPEEYRENWNKGKSFSF